MRRAGRSRTIRQGGSFFSFWIHSFRKWRQLKYIGFNGTDHQVKMHSTQRYCPTDLPPNAWNQMDSPKIINVGGSIENSMSIKQLSDCCEERFGLNEVISSFKCRPLDGPWYCDGLYRWSKCRTGALKPKLSKFWKRSRTIWRKSN